MYHSLVYLSIFETEIVINESCEKARHIFSIIPSSKTEHIMVDRLPNLIQDYPQDGQLKYLFRKRITRSDMDRGLTLTGESCEYLRGLPKPMLDMICSTSGLVITVYTPHYDDIVPLKTYGGAQGQGSFKLRKMGWDRVALASGYAAGQEIDCWCLSQQEDGEGGEGPELTLSLLIEEVLNVQPAPQAGTS